ncbi:MAG: HXXEE domain-containing protein [Candidatus Thorarchaeota archaeon]
MKVFKPLVAFLLLLTIVSIVAGMLFPGPISTLSYSPTLFLLVCFANALHFLEEDFTKAWEVEGQLRKNSDGTPKESLYDKAFFVAFSHSIILLSFLFYFPIANGDPWAWLFGLGVSFNGILNGLIHLGIFAKFRRNTGVVSGLLQLIFGSLVIVSLFIPIV